MSLDALLPLSWPRLTSRGVLPMIEDYHVIPTRKDGAMSSYSDEVDELRGSLGRAVVS